MPFRTLVVLLSLLGTSSAIADLKPDALDCDPKKAARNAAMDATVGVSGRCDSGKAAKNAKEDAVGNVKDAADIDKKPLRDGKSDKHIPKIGKK